MHEPDDGPLGGRVILVTRGRWEGLLQRIEALGGRAELRPTIEVRPPADPGPAREALRTLDAYDLVVFTSGNGARSFAELRSSEIGDRGGWGARVAAIGPATALALAEVGIAPVIVAVESRAEGLAETLLAGGVAGRRVLLVQPDVARPILAEALLAAGARVDAVPFYRTVASPQVAAIATDVASGRYHAVVFTSPSSLERLLEAPGIAPARTVSGLRRIHRVAIGPTTAGALQEARLPPHGVAAAPSDEAVARAVVEAFDREVARADYGKIRPLFASRRRRRGPIPGGRPTLSSEPSAPRRTALYDEHVASGARIVPFAGFLMPLQYSGVLEEHLAVRKRAGLFDVGHMGEIEAIGPGALAFLQHLTPNDVARLVPGRVQYNALLTQGGCFVDDLLIYRMGEAEYLLVVNAANIEKDFGHLSAHAAGFDVKLANVSLAWGQVALQGPLSADILQPLTAAKITAMRYYAFERADVAGVPCIVSRTGYTGEDGFEVYMPAEAAPGIWRSILEAGSRVGLVPCGLGARDTLRLEARMHLYGNDMDETTTALEADLGWIVKLDKGTFLGREILEEQKREGVGRKLVGFEMEGRAIARHGYRAWAEGRPVGQVTSGTYAPFLKKSIGLVYLPRGLWEPGTRFEVEVRGRREGAVVVPTPFYRRDR